MAVVVIEEGRVVGTFLDVTDVPEAMNKYPHLRGDGVHLERGNHSAGTLFDGATFTAPPVPPKPPKQESDVVWALRELAGEIGPAAVALILERFGPAPGE